MRKFFVTRLFLSFAQHFEWISFRKNLVSFSQFAVFRNFQSVLGSKFLELKNLEPKNLFEKTFWGLGLKNFWKVRVKEVGLSEVLMQVKKFQLVYSIQSKCNSHSIHGLYGLEGTPTGIFFELFWEFENLSPPVHPVHPLKFLSPNFNANFNLALCTFIAPLCTFMHLYATWIIFLFISFSIVKILPISSLNFHLFLPSFHFFSCFLLK